MNGRFLCSMDAVTRILGFHTYPKSDPPVLTIKAKLESDVAYLLQQNLSCDFFVYLQRPFCLADLTYTQLFQSHRADVTLPNYVINSGEEYFEIGVPGQLNKPLFLYKRRDSLNLIVRMEMVYVNSGELWYLRIILLKYPIKSFVDGKTDKNGRLWETFQQRAISDGLIKEHRECERCFDDAAPTSTPAQLRGLFVLMMTEGYPVLIIYDDPERVNLMMADYLRYLSPAIIFYDNIINIVNHNYFF